MQDGPRTKMLEAWSRGFVDNRFFCQINLALHPDSSLWVVPGSNRRREDTAAETRRFPDQTRPIPAPDLEGLSNEERLATCRAYAQSMPGAVQLHLQPGDCCFYRNTVQHPATLRAPVSLVSHRWRGVAALALRVLRSCAAPRDPPRHSRHTGVCVALASTASFCAQAKSLTEAVLLVDVAYRTAMDELGGGTRTVPEAALEGYRDSVWPWAEEPEPERSAAARL